VLVAATAGAATAGAATAGAATVAAATALAATAETMIGRVMATIFWATEALKHLDPKEKGPRARGGGGGGGSGGAGGRRAMGEYQKFIGFVRKTLQYGTACT
jgi:hypothetical protein